MGIYCGFQTKNLPDEPLPHHGKVSRWDTATKAIHGAVGEHEDIWPNDYQDYHPFSTTTFRRYLKYCGVLDQVEKLEEAFDEEFDLRFLDRKINTS